MSDTTPNAAATAEQDAANLEMVATLLSASGYMARAAQMRSLASRLRSREAAPQQTGEPTWHCLDCEYYGPESLVRQHVADASHTISPNTSPAPQGTRPITDEAEVRAAVRGLSARQSCEIARWHDARCTAAVQELHAVHMRQMGALINGYETRLSALSVADPQQEPQRPAKGAGWYEGRCRHCLHLLSAHACPPEPPTQRELAEVASPSTQEASNG